MAVGGGGGLREGSLGMDARSGTVAADRDPSIFNN
jgi:hypothetical protein